MTYLIDIAIRAVCVLLTVWIHEVPKAAAAYSLTHPIHRKKEDFRLDLKSYIDPIGFLLFLFMNFGWQKPAEYNASRYKDRDRGLVAVAMAGQLANILAVAVFLLLRRYAGGPVWNLFTLYMVYFNFAIVLVNFLPVPPLEASKLVYAYSSNAYFKLIQNARMVHVVFLLLIFLGFIGSFINLLFEPIRRIL
ncbi:site-2 protease family protein [Anaerotalea alkaliphila]|uniref:Site-2 protease family protein n=1 Tax=Anaerotalea alkaliphila TaxID=2662126 RepID=A0A7X5HTD9_9FIRM|nr:site-2 protease family protein [Anaerotalea alkaliphila]NDL66291.1 site-2 protease family protein [Anaerotalea alkaliphila]